MSTDVRLLRTRQQRWRLLLFHLALYAVVCALTTSEKVRATQAPSVEQILQVAGTYVQQYERDISAVVAHEDYQQLVQTREQLGNIPTRKTRAYLLVIDMGRPGWVAFRDVFEVDGKAVRERDERLSRLLAQLTPDSLEQARQIAAESARFNLNPSGVRLDRSINTPMTSLLFLRAANQSRSVFRLGKTDRIAGVTCVTLSFTENTKPRLIRSSDDAAARGSFCIDPTQGRVLRSELSLDVSGSDGTFVRSQITVKYGLITKLDQWLPVTMDETYEVRPSLHFISGHAEYTDFRQFTVTTTEGAK